MVRPDGLACFRGVEGAGCEHEQRVQGGGKGRCETPGLTRMNSLKIKLIGVESNRTAIGARIDLRVGTCWHLQEVLSQSSYYSVNDLRLHFGLGGESKADELLVRWPNGKPENHHDLPADQLVYIEEGNEIVRLEKL